MAKDTLFILGEFRRTIDERFRISVPNELIEPLVGSDKDCIIAKECSGALSIWNAKNWQENLKTDVTAVEALMQAGRLQDQIGDIQTLGRLLSTRHKPVQFAGRGRLLIPEGFREFLGVNSGGEVLVVGAAVCVELWRPDAWLSHLEEKIPEFQQLVTNLLGKT